MTNKEKVNAIKAKVVWMLPSALRRYHGCEQQTDTRQQWIIQKTVMRVLVALVVVCSTYLVGEYQAMLKKFTNVDNNVVYFM